MVSEEDVVRMLGWRGYQTMSQQSEGAGLPAEADAIDQKPTAATSTLSFLQFLWKIGVNVNERES